MTLVSGPCSQPPSLHSSWGLPEQVDAGHTEVLTHLESLLRLHFTFFVPFKGTEMKFVCSSEKLTARTNVT